MAKKNGNGNNGTPKVDVTIPTGIVFNAPGANAPATLVAEAEVPIHKGPLAGLKVTGIRIWRRRQDGHLFVTFPARPDGERSWEHVRATDGRRSTVDAAKAGILAAYNALAGETVPVPASTTEEVSAS